MGEWTLFSNHGHVLVSLANNNEARLRDVAAEVGITERAVQNILRELQGSGLVQVTKHGRCNRYQINTRKSLRHPLESHVTVGRLLQLLRPDTSVAPEPVAAASAPPKTPAPATPPPAQPVAAPPPAKPASASKPRRPKPEAAPETVPETAPETAPEAAPEAVPAAAVETKKDKKSDIKQSDTGETSTRKEKPAKPDTQQGSLF